MHPAVMKHNQLVDQCLVVSDPWGAASDKAKTTANQRKIIVDHISSLRRNLSLNGAIQQYLLDIHSASVSAQLSAAHEYTRGPKKNTLRNWVNAFESGGLNALLPAYSGTSRAEYGWESRALELYHRPQKPSLAKVARDLRERYGFSNASEANVRYFFSTLPADLQDKSPWRMGRKLYKDGLREHNTRSTETLPLGFLYQGDGHCIDEYVKHPKTGNIYRPELIVWMDVKSRYIAGWYVDIVESSINTMAALSDAIGSHNHVPAMVHVDHGSGFKSKMMNDDTSGFYASFGIEPIFALPGNAKAKNVERFFRTMEDDYGKDWDTYCGYAMSKDASRHFSSEKLKKREAEGKIHVPTLKEWMQGFEQWLTRYHARPHPEYPDTTPEKMWAELERVPVEDLNLLVKPRAKVKVIRSTITLHKRQYHAEYLHQYNSQELVAEYCLKDDSMIRIFDMQGKWLTTATLKHKHDYIPASRIDEAATNRLTQQKKRLQNKIDEKERQSLGHMPNHIDQADQVSELEESINELLTSQQPSNDDLLNAVTQDLIRLDTAIEDDTDCETSLLDLMQQN